MHCMKSPFWIIVGGSLLLTYVLAALIANSGPPRVGYEPPGNELEVARHLIAVTWLGIVWAIIFRTELESRKLSLRSLFALLTIQAFGFWLVKIAKSGWLDGLVGKGQASY